MPRVSVIIPTYNCAHFLERALQSIISQTYSDYEIIVAEDGSTDETFKLLSKWESKICYAYQPNSGLPSARNLAISKSGGEYLAYLDADAMWYPDKLQQQVAFLDAHPECGLVHSDLRYIDEHDQVITPDWHRERRGSSTQGFCLTELLRNCLIQVPTVLERRTCYDRTSGFDERFRRVEDYLHWTQIALDGQAIGYIDAPLAMYRCRADSLSNNEAAMAEATIQMFETLTTEHALYERAEPEAKEIVSWRLASLRRSLPYLYRDQGRLGLARQRSVALIKDHPTDIYAYVELLKSCLPVNVAGASRKLGKLMLRANRHFSSTEYLTCV